MYNNHRNLNSSSNSGITVITKIQNLEQKINTIISKIDKQSPNNINNDLSIQIATLEVKLTKMEELCKYFIKKDDVSHQLDQYLKKDEVSHQLDQYLKKDEVSHQLDQYLKKDEINIQYFLDIEIETHLTQYIKKSEIDRQYPKKDEINQQLTKYISARDFKQELTKYSTKESQANYVHKDEYEKTLESLYTKNKEILEFTNNISTKDVPKNLPKIVSTYKDNVEIYHDDLVYNIKHGLRLSNKSGEAFFMYDCAKSATIEGHHKWLGWDKTKSGKNSHAEGKDTYSYGENSHSEGSECISISDACHSEGFKTCANARYSHAEGRETASNGQASHAEGHKTSAEGAGSHSEGMNCKAIGPQTHAEGRDCKADGAGSHSEGYSTTTSGESSHSEGNRTKAIGDSSHAEGYMTKAGGKHSHAQGCYSSSPTQGQFAVSSGHFDIKSNNQRSFYHLRCYNNKNTTAIACCNWDNLEPPPELSEIFIPLPMIWLVTLKAMSYHSSSLYEYTSSFIIKYSKTPNISTFIVNNKNESDELIIFPLGNTSSKSTITLNIHKSETLRITCNNKETTPLYWSIMLDTHELNYVP